MCTEIWNRSAPSTAPFRLSKEVKMRHFFEDFLATLRQKHIQGSLEGTLAMQWFAPAFSRRASPKGLAGMLQCKPYVSLQCRGAAHRV